MIGRTYPKCGEGVVKAFGSLLEKARDFLTARLAAGRELNKRKRRRKRRTLVYWRCNGSPVIFLYAPFFCASPYLTVDVAEKEYGRVAKRNETEQ